MLRLPPPKSKSAEILVVYGHHAGIERMFGIAEVFNRYGGVTIPDLPGFGGMQSFYKIGLTPTLDNLADYLAVFVKWRYKKGNITIAATSFGFAVVTRMLQKYPDIANRVTVLIGFVGFTHKSDFALSKDTMLLGKTLSAVFSRRVPAYLLKTCVLRGPLIRAVYKRSAAKNAKLKDAESPEVLEKRIDFEVWLWQNNDIRTHMFTQGEFLRIDLCGVRVPNVRLHHVSVAKDKYFDKHSVEQHLRIIFGECDFAEAKLNAHAPTIIASAKEAAQLIPPKTRAVLRTIS